EAMCASLALHLGLQVSTPEDLGLSSPEHKYLFRKSRVRDVRLRTLWSSVFMDRYSFEFFELSSTDKSRILLDARDKLYSFRRQLHPQVQLDRNSITPSIIYLHMSYHMSHILIHRPYLKGAVQSDTYKLCVWSMSSAAASIVRLLREYRKVAVLDQVSPFIVHSVLTAAVTHLCNATSTHQPLRSQSIAWFRVCFDALRAMQRRWIKAKRGIRLLQELARRWQVMVALPLQHGF
ncbi:hypothetical protein ASPCADRAFT_29463, partial [Aspergillus carbonarius ITEM 5010]